ncbi:MAG: GGDEF domain-containing protein [Solirubrobacteraceae bacterium]
MWAIVGAGSALLLAHAQGRVRNDNEQRFALRATIASRFVTTDVDDLTTRQSADATRNLTGTISHPGWLPWSALIAFMLVSLFAVLILLRYLHGRADLARVVTLLEKIIRVDPLTDLYNRRGLDEQLERASGQARRHRQPLTVMLIDVDHFKQVNDTWGHQAGDMILAELADLMRGAIRVEDVLGRWGGEEFLAILPDTGPDAAVDLANRLRTLIEANESTLPDGSVAMVTVSIGVCTGMDDAPDKQIALADRALYAAKAGGRNRVADSRDLLVAAV